ncbi:MAG: FKBP-type peptidyl-prolyl cis-trans isomerase [Prevotellaceae bacterium]|jgi:FKBP-type peptidyl-prolyl cis-trans isomerase|nr:FKBP-type peptidyl-prolyl cis-trans isomerase [Prevotellaceae bacterium]
MNKYLLFFSLAAVVSGCAKSIDEDADNTEKKLLRAYVEMQAQAGVQYDSTASGLYYRFPEGRKAGGESPSDTDFLYVNYTMYDLKGNIATSQYNQSEVAKQLGVFSASTYYGPRLWRVGKSALTGGLEEALHMMKEGEKMRVLIPSWLSAISGSDTRQYSATTMFDIELLRVVPDIRLFETDTLHKFSVRHYNGIDSVKKDWYYTELQPGDASETVASIGDTLKVRYVGYLLDGFVFDTNIADSASYHKIYNSSNDYATLAVVYQEATDTDGSGDAEGTMDVVDGFKYALQQMKPGSEAVTFFSSDYGYKAAGSGQIPAYAPLRFYIKLEGIGRKQ